MPAATTVHEARQRLQDCFNRFLDRVAPSSGALPLSGTKFVDWEDLIMPEGFEVLAAAMEGAPSWIARLRLKRRAVVLIVVPSARIRKSRARRTRSARQWERSKYNVNMRAAGPAVALFFSQNRDWCLPAEVPKLSARIADGSHAEEHLYDCARAVHGSNQILTESLAAPLVNLLWNGRVEEVVVRLAELSAKLGAPQEGDGPQHPRPVLANNIGYFERNKKHMNYPEYRRRGWPIGSGNVEASVKLAA